MQVCPVHEQVTGSRDGEQQGQPSPLGPRRPGGHQTAGLDGRNREEHDGTEGHGDGLQCEGVDPGPDVLDHHEVGREQDHGRQRQEVATQLEFAVRSTTEHHDSHPANGHEGDPD